MYLLTEKNIDFSLQPKHLQVVTVDGSRDQRQNFKPCSYCHSKHQVRYDAVILNPQYRRLVRVRKWAAFNWTNEHKISYVDVSKNIRVRSQYVSITRREVPSSIIRKHVFEGNQIFRFMVIWKNIFENILL